MCILYSKGLASRFIKITLKKFKMNVKVYYTYNDSEVLKKNIPQGLGNRYVAFVKKKNYLFMKAIMLMV